MTTKSKPKKTTTRKGSANKPREAITARANTIIEDSTNYDADARHAVGYALSTLRFYEGDSAGSVGDRAAVAKSISEAEAELREAIRKAEAGEPSFDVEEIGAEYVNAARIIHDVISGTNSIPLFVYDAVRVALDEVARRTGSTLWVCADEARSVETGGYSVERIARVFKYHSFEKIGLEPKKDLAQMIADVWNDPDCPDDISGALNEGTSDLFNSLNRTVPSTAPYIRALILEHQTQKGGQE
jgi:hypothetical protein